MSPPVAGVRFCASCGASTSPGARFCHQCGHPLGPVGRRLSASLLAGVGVVLAAVAIALFVSLRRSPGSAGAAAAPSLAGRAPDISAMSPRERFDRLFERAEEYAAQGDTVNMLRFADHALAAYAQLDEVDADARYRAGVLLVHAAHYEAALALADSILADDPRHRLGLELRAAATRLRARR